MAILLSAHQLAHSFGVRALFEGVSFTLSDGDRVGLIGPNGAGKSTLLKILAGTLSADRGQMAPRAGLRVGYLAQVPALTPGTTVREAVHEGLGSADDDGRVDELLAKMDLGSDAAGAERPVDQLSGGWRKRVALAQALVRDPELLLLDEPTNHLDVEAIVWLEKFLANARFATLTVTHDRLFLQRVANRILELDRRNADGLMDVAGDYATYVERKAEAMHAQERREDVLRNTLRRETEWLRRGPQARTTKQQARIQRAGALADEVSGLSSRNQVRGVDLEFAARGKSPRRLIEARSIGKRFGERVLFEGVDLFIGPGTRVGLLGPNGCGKSTLLRVLTGDDTPTEGAVLRADSLRVAFFEQNRESLDPARSLADTVCPDGDFVSFRGARVHRFGYLERFLFRSEQMMLPVGRLSGGEQSRLLIARLMLLPADVLVLDEPTNDLDLATLQVLEEALISFDGAVLLVTHDRYFLDQVATQILAFHTKPGEEGQVMPLVGLSQWDAWHATQVESRAERRAREAGGSVASAAASAGAGAPAGANSNKKKNKFSFKDQRDWDTMEARIAAAEAALAALEIESQSPSVVSDGPRLLALAEQIQKARAAVDALYARWAELEAMQS